jgi:hypothetical protein
VLVFVIVKDGWEACPITVYNDDVLAFVTECKAWDVDIIGTLKEDDTKRLVWEQGMLEL